MERKEGAMNPKLLCKWKTPQTKSTDSGLKSLYNS